MGKGVSSWVMLLQLVLVGLISTRVSAISAIANAPENARWKCSDKNGVATFLPSPGKDQETAVMVLEKSNVLGQPITVESDCTYIILRSGKSPSVVFNIPVNPSGTTSKIEMIGGDSATIKFNDKEDVKEQGKWIQMAADTDQTITMELGKTSYAKVTFSLGGNPPPPPPVPPVPSHKEIPKTRELLHPVQPKDLSGACKAFHLWITKQCAKCGGSGKISQQVQDGTRQSGPFSVPILKTEEVTCPVCKGSGIDRASDPVLFKSAGNIVKDLGGVNKDDPKAQQVLTDTYAEITDDMIGDQQTYSMLYDKSKALLAQNPTLGTTVVILASVKQATPLADDHHRYLLQIAGTNRNVYLDDPVLDDHPTTGYAFMGGVVGQPETNDADGQKIVVLHGGFLITPAINKAWKWWYRNQ